MSSFITILKQQLCNDIICHLDPCQWMAILIYMTCQLIMAEQIKVFHFQYVKFSDVCELVFNMILFHPYSISVLHLGPT